jgi:hypothetical protein
VAVMASIIFESRLVMMYIKGLTKPLHGWVKDFNLVTLQVVIEHKIYLVGAAYKNKITPKPPIITRGRDIKKVDKGKANMDEATRRDLRRKQLCFTCK